jgi:hypothetical protein
MKTMKTWGFFRKAWLCPCLLSLLTACSTLQKAGPEQPSYRITITLPPGSSENQLIAVLNESHPAHVDFKPYTDGYDNSHLLNGSRTVTVTLPDETAMQNFRQQLQNAGVPIQTIHIEH